MRDRIETDWYLIQGTLGFFRCLKKLHNALQGVETELCGELGLTNDQVSGAGEGEQLWGLIPAGDADVPLDLDQELLQQVRHGDHPVRSDGAGQMVPARAAGNPSASR